MSPSTAEARHIRVFSWRDTFEALVDALSEYPSFHDVIATKMVQVSPKDVQYADILCSRPDILKCLGAAGSSKGGSNAAAWPLQLTLRGFSEAKTAALVKWGSLPHNTRYVRIAEAAGDVDVAHIVTQLPRFVKKLEIVDSHVVATTSSSSSPSESSNDSELYFLTFRGCRIEKAFFKSVVTMSKHSSSSPSPFAHVRSLVLEDCELAQSALPSFLGALTKLETLNIARSRDTNNNRNKNNLPLFEILSAMPSSTHSVLAQVEIEGLTPQKQNNQDLHVADADNDAFWEVVAKMKELIILKLSRVFVPGLPSSFSSSSKFMPPSLSHLSLIEAGLNHEASKHIDTTSFGTLHELDLTGNSVTHFPFAGAKPPLKRINLALNALTSVDFASLASHIVALNVSNNQLSGGADLTKLPSEIELFDISFNSLSGPVNMREFPASMRHVYINSNAFTGRPDVSKLPLLSVNVMFGENNWDSLMPSRRRKDKNKNMK